MTANTIKNHLLRYFRFMRGCAYVATECWKEDVVASDGEKLICVEVKMSWSDYQREYSKSKHTVNSSPWNIYMVKFPRRNNPNRRYFAAPNELASRIADDLKERKSEYGCLAVEESGEVQVIRRATKLHSVKARAESLRDIVLRLTSELITIRTQVRT